MTYASCRTAIHRLLASFGPPLPEDIADALGTELPDLPRPPSRPSQGLLSPRAPGSEDWEDHARKSTEYEDELAKYQHELAEHRDRLDGVARQIREVIELAAEVAESTAGTQLMARRFTKLTRPNIRGLKHGEKITEHGITAECLASGDVRYSVNDMVDGARIHRVVDRESEGVTPTQAEDFIEAKRTEAREGRLALPKGRKLALTFKGAADLYLDKLREVGGKDYANNETHLRRHLVPYLGKMRLDQISVFTLQKFRRHCMDKGLTESTADLILATYRRMSRKLAECNILAVPMPMIRLKSQHNRRTYVISDDEEKQLLDAALADSNSYIWLFIKLGMATSLRHNEMLTARFECFDDAMRRRLRVNVKGGKWRNQPLTRGITAILEHEREMAADQDGWIFPNPGAKPHPENKRAFARCVERAEMDPEIVTPHVMRHTAITRLAETGVDIRTLQEFSGHETLVMVMRYTHAQDRAIDRALDALEARTVSEHPRAHRPANS